MLNRTIWHNQLILSLTKASECLEAWKMLLMRAHPGLGHLARDTLPALGSHLCSTLKLPEQPALVCISLWWPMRWPDVRNSHSLYSPPPSMRSLSGFGLPSPEFIHARLFIPDTHETFVSFSFARQTEHARNAGQIFIPSWPPLSTLHLFADQWVL